MRKNFKVTVSNTMGLCLHYDREKNEHLNLDIYANYHLLL
jgi:hypothetical protein